MPKDSHTASESLRGPDVAPRLRRGYLAAGLALIALIATLATACGPALTTGRLNSAQEAVAAAAEQGAADSAVYEFVLAEEYLKKAQEEWGLSDFKAVREYAELAERFARLAAERAGGEGVE